MSELVQNPNNLSSEPSSQSPLISQPPEMTQPNSQEYEDSLILLDGTTSQIPTIIPELETQKKTAADPNRPVEERIEAYEDIMESEVGDSTMSRTRNIERQLGPRQIFMKFKGRNPTSTEKDRIAFAQVVDATVATCGNYSAAVAMVALLAKLRCPIFITETFHTKRIKEMTDLGAEIIGVPSDYENTTILSRECLEKDEIYDANPDGFRFQLARRW